MMYIAKIEGGNVEIYDADSGHYHRRVGDPGAVNALIQGSAVSITYGDGRVDIYDVDSGHYKRTIY